MRAEDGANGVEEHRQQKAQTHTQAYAKGDLGRHVGGASLIFRIRGEA